MQENKIKKYYVGTLGSRQTPEATGNKEETKTSSRENIATFYYSIMCFQVKNEIFLMPLTIYGGVPAGSRPGLNWTTIS